MANWRRMRQSQPTQGPQPPPPKKSKIPSVLIFVLLIVVFILVFGGVLAWMIRQGGAKNVDDNDKEKDVSGPQVLLDENDEWTILLTLIDKNEAVGFYITHIDPANTKVSTMGFAPNTKIEYEKNKTQLGEFYKQEMQNNEIMLKVFSNLCGIEVDYYAVISYSEVESIYKHFDEELKYKLPQSISVKSGKYKAEQATYKPEQIVEILQYDKWEKGSNYRAFVHADILSTTINQFLTTKREKTDDFAFIIEKVQPSSIKKADHLVAKPGLDWLRSKNTAKNPVASSIEIFGEYIKEGDKQVFIPDKKLYKKLEKVLK